LCPGVEPAAPCCSGLSCGGTAVDAAAASDCCAALTGHSQHVAAPRSCIMLQSKVHAGPAVCAGHMGLCILHAEQGAPPPATQAAATSSSNQLTRCMRRKVSSGANLGGLQQDAFRPQAVASTPPRPAPYGPAMAPSTPRSEMVILQPKMQHKCVPSQP
jgi:hypothetical protein